MLSRTLPTGNAIGSRGKSFKSYTVKDRKKDLEEFQKTGIHPDIEAARKRAAADTLLALPDPDASRPRTYIEFAVDKAVIGVQNCALTLACHPIVVAVVLWLLISFNGAWGEISPENCSACLSACQAGSHVLVCRQGGVRGVSGRHADAGAHICEPLPGRDKRHPAGLSGEVKPQIVPLSVTGYPAVGHGTDVGSTNEPQQSGQSLLHCERLEPSRCTRCCRA